MTKGEAIQRLSDLQDGSGQTYEAIRMAINALAVYPQYKWERDIALAQLEEYGIGFAEKKRDDLVSVVRCKDCRYWYKKMNKCNRCPSISGNWGTNDFCSYGEGGDDE